MNNGFQRCYINLVCMKQNKDLKDIFEICGSIFEKLRYYNFNYQILQFDIRDNFDYKCDGLINGICSVLVQNENMKTICITVKKKNLSYNIYHAFGHFIQKYGLNEYQIQKIYQQYLQKSDILNLPHDYSIIKNECIPQLIAHYFLDQLNDQAKKFVQENILK